MKLSRSLFLLALFILLVVVSRGSPFVIEAAPVVENVYAELTSDFGTASISYQDALTIDAIDFTANADYLIVVYAALRGDNVSDTFFVRVTHGDIEFTGSEMIFEPVNVTRVSSYGYMTQYTVPASTEAVVIEIRSNNGSNTVTLDAATIIGIRLDVDLSTPSDYSFNEDNDTGAPTVHTITPVSFASITFTPNTTGEDWLIIGSYSVDINNVGKNYLIRINFDSDTEVAPQISEEGEDNNEQRVRLIHRVFNLDNTSHTFTMQGSDDSLSGPENDHRRSAIFALRLPAFEDHKFNWTETALDDELIFTEIAAINFTPQTTGNFFFLGGIAYDALNVSGASQIRIQVAGANPFFMAERNEGVFDATDETPIFIGFRETLAASAQDIDFDAIAIGGNGAWEDRSIVLWSAELAGAAPPPDVRRNPILITMRQK